MPFSNPRNAATSYLILRELADGGVIDWPLDEADAQRPLFDGLEAGGFIVRWDRVWPLHDRYRLTEKGIQALEAVYNPGAASPLIERIRAQDLPPAQRRAQLLAVRLDPVVWPILHDPYTHWSSIRVDQGHLYRFFWEDQVAPRRKPAPRKPAPKPKPPKPPKVGFGNVAARLVNVHHHHHVDGTLVDLDRDADPDYIPPDPGGDVDVS